MSDLRDLYQEVILDHNKRPRNFGPLADADRSLDGHNPLCGDKLTVFLRVEDGRVADVSFVGTGCAISKASASMMTDVVKGRPLDDVETLFTKFHDMITASPAAAAAAAADLGKLAVFAGVAEYPARVKCATLAWHTLHAAMHGASNTVKTEGDEV